MIVDRPVPIGDVIAAFPDFAPISIMPPVMLRTRISVNPYRRGTGITAEGDTSTSHLPSPQAARVAGSGRSG
jgi:hypothetical protein